MAWMAKAANWLETMPKPLILRIPVRDRKTELPASWYRQKLKMTFHVAIRVK
jgi:hypothetical protein